MKPANITEVVFHATGERKFFTSITAIFDYYTEEELGCNLPMIWASKFNTTSRFKNHKIEIFKHQLFGRVK